MKAGGTMSFHPPRKRLKNCVVVFFYTNNLSEIDGTLSRCVLTRRKEGQKTEDSRGLGTIFSRRRRRRTSCGVAVVRD